MVSLVRRKTAGLHVLSELASGYGRWQRCHWSTAGARRMLAGRAHRTHRTEGAAGAGGPAPLPHYGSPSDAVLISERGLGGEVTPGQGF